MKWNRCRKWYRRLADWILEIEEAIFGEDVPEGWKKVDSYFVSEDLDRECPSAQIFLVDGNYYLPTLDEVYAFLEMDDTEKETYVTDLHDCDDFSFRLMGQFHKKPWSAAAIGIAWSNVHAYNIVITQEGTFLIEPQTDELLKQVSADDAYKTEFIFM